MMTTKELFDTLKRLDFSHYKYLIKSSGYNGSDFEKLEADFDNPDDQQMYFVLLNIITSLNEIHYDLEYYSKPVKSVETLYMNSDGRYECKSCVFHCGTQIEFFAHDVSWELSTVEYGSNGYYVYGFKDVDMNGLKVRIR